jgi:hypothetical protein
MTSSGFLPLALICFIYLFTIILNFLGRGRLMELLVALVFGGDEFAFALLGKFGLQSLSDVFTQASGKILTMGGRPRPTVVSSSNRPSRTSLSVSIEVPSTDEDAPGEGGANVLNFLTLGNVDIV